MSSQESVWNFTKAWIGATWHSAVYALMIYLIFFMILAQFIIYSGELKEF